jgi:hypothetical protein
LVIIQSGKSTFGAFTTFPRKESKDFYVFMNVSCTVYYYIGLQYIDQPINPTILCSATFYARSRGCDQEAQGIGFGGTSKAKPAGFWQDVVI